MYGSKVGCVFDDDDDYFDCFLSELTDIENKQGLSFPPVHHPIEDIKGFQMNTKEHNQASLDHFPAEIFVKFPFLNAATIQSEIDELKSQDFLNAKLTNLNLKSNNLQKLTAGTFDQLNLGKLGLEDNKIETIDDFTFNNQSSLKELSLNGNKLKWLKRNMFAGLVELVTLNLDRNEIHTIEDGTFVNLLKLWRLELRGNKLKSLSDNLFSGLPALGILDLSKNEIERVGNALPTSKNVYIDISNNPINAIDLEKVSKISTINTAWSDYYRKQIAPMNLNICRAALAFLFWWKNILINTTFSFIKIKYSGTPSFVGNA